jgi:hypothetical protein
MTEPHRIDGTYPTVDEIVNAAKADPVPDEVTEEFAREMRTQYTALVRQGFTDDQALRIVGYSIAALLTAATLGDPT